MILHLLKILYLVLYLYFLIVALELLLVLFPMSSSPHDTSFYSKNGWTVRLWVQNLLSACVIY